MEYGILAAVILAVVFAFYKRPNHFKAIVSKSLIKKLKTNKEGFVDEIYNKFPNEVKIRLGRNILRYLISTSLEIVASILEDEVKKKAKR